MLTKLQELQEIAKQKLKKTLILAVAHDEHSLEAVHKAIEENIINAILVGDEKKINEIASKLSIDISNSTIINELDNEKAVEIAVKKIHYGEASILMKGKVTTAILLKAVLNKEWGLRKGELLSHFAIFEIEAYHKLIALADGGMNIAPDLKAKASIISNSVEFLNKLGLKIPKVAVLCAVEIINEAMPATLDAALLSKMSQRGQIKNCIIEGPLAFDNAINIEAAHNKNIYSEVAGDADLLIVPDIEAGNILYKTLIFFSKAKVSSLVLGATAPIVLTSRSDSEESKFNSIVLAAAID